MQYRTVDEWGEVRKRRGVSYYHQLYLLLSAALNEGTIAAGSALPSESEMMARFAVSRNTVRRALGELEREKRIVRRRGSGSYARLLPAEEPSVESIDEVLSDFRDSPAASRLLRVQKTKTPEFIRRKDASFGESSLLVQRCRTFRDDPIMLSTSYVPEEIGDKLSRRALSHQVVSSALGSAGFMARTADQFTTAALADSFTARHLGVEPASALLCIHRLIRDRDGRSIEHQSHMYRPELRFMQAKVSAEKSPAGPVWSEVRLPRLPIAL